MNPDADGVRGLLIDTHYGFDTPRGVATDLAHDSKSRAKIEGEVGPAFVATAERLRTRIGYEGGGTREIFLCHAFCEVGATVSVEALDDGAYSLPDSYVGEEGTNWIDHWAITRGQPPQGVPSFPQKILDMAKAIPRPTQP